MRTQLEDLSQEAAIISAMTYAQQKGTLTRHLKSQVEELFRHVKETGGMDPYPEPLTPDPATLTLPEQTVVEKSLDAATDHVERMIKRDEQILAKAIPHPSGSFSLQIARSSIEHPAAGFGTLRLILKIIL